MAKKIVEVKDTKKSKGKIDIAGIMRINSEKAENYTEVKSNRISFEKN